MDGRVLKGSKSVQQNPAFLSSPSVGPLHEPFSNGTAASRAQARSLTGQECNSKKNEKVFDPNFPLVELSRGKNGLFLVQEHVFTQNHENRARRELQNALLLSFW